MKHTINDKSELNGVFEQAFQNNSEYIAVLVSIGERDPEVIINGKHSMQTKLEYYNSVYDLSLDHKHANGIKIVGAVFGDSFDEIEYKITESEVKSVMQGV